LQAGLGCHRAAGNLLHPQITLGHRLRLALGLLFLRVESGLFFDCVVEDRDGVAQAIFTQSTGRT